MILGVSEFLCDLGGPGHLTTINVPIGISIFQRGAARNPPSRPKIDFPRIMLKTLEFSTFQRK